MTEFKRLKRLFELVRVKSVQGWQKWDLSSRALFKVELHLSVLVRDDLLDTNKLAAKRPPGLRQSGPRFGSGIQRQDHRRDLRTSLAPAPRDRCSQRNVWLSLN